MFACVCARAQKNFLGFSLEFLLKTKNQKLKTKN